MRGSTDSTRETSTRSSIPGYAIWTSNGVEVVMPGFYPTGNRAPRRSRLGLPEPTTPAGAAELRLFGRVLERTRAEGAGRRRATEEVDVDARDGAVTDLEVARCNALVRLRRRAATEAFDQHVGDGARLAFGEHAGARHWRARDVTHRIDVGELRGEGRGVDGDPPVVGEPGRHDHGGRGVHRDAEEEVVRDHATVGD